MNYALSISAALATYPLEVVETRLIAQNCQEPTYRGLLHSLSTIYRNEGLQALYRGFSLTVLGMYFDRFHLRIIKLRRRTVVK
uniref:Uncharacterized protein n=1 Tax=Sinocyclocheilus anshuiensis TaxID=1608454 RepID=A0A671M9Y8_9TELE